MNKRNNNKDNNNSARMETSKNGRNDDAFEEKKGRVA